MRFSRKVFLRGTPSAEISRQLTIARWRFRIVFLVIGVTYTFPNTVLARFHPSGDSTLLPFSEGRFLLQPGSSVLTTVALLFWRRELRRDLVMIDDLFTRLARWTSTSATHSFANPSSSEAASSNPSATANKDGAIASSKPAFARAASQRFDFLPYAKVKGSTCLRSSSTSRTRSCPFGKQRSGDHVEGTIAVRKQRSGELGSPRVLK